LAAHLDEQNPWPGLMAFDEASQPFFHGRLAETDELYRLVRRETVSVLFGPSGLGKTSLLRAGLFPALRAEQHLPVYLRLDFAPGAIPFTEQVFERIRQECLAHGVEAPALAEASLWAFFHRPEADFWDARNRPVCPVLVFDQFEEVFTLGQVDPERHRRCLELIQELSCLTEHRVPEVWKQRFEADPELTRGFAFRRAEFRVLLSFREEYLADFEALHQDFLAALSNRMRLRPLNGATATEAVAQAGRALLTPGIAREIVDFVSRGKGIQGFALEARPVEPALLSMVCHELNLRRQALGAATLDADLLTVAQEEIIADYYRRCLEDQSPAMAEFVERLVSEGGFRVPFALVEALKVKGVDRASLDVLITRRLLRLEERFGVPSLELMHDKLIPVIQARQEDRRQRARAALKRRRTASLLAISVLLLIALGMVGGLVLRNRKAAAYHELQNRKAAAAFEVEQSQKREMLEKSIQKLNRIREELFLMKQFLVSGKVPEAITGELTTVYYRLMNAIAAEDEIIKQGPVRSNKAKPPSTGEISEGDLQRVSGGYLVKGHHFKILDEIVAQHGDLVKLVLRTESMDNGEKQYWFDILPSMTKEQIGRLNDILETERRKLEELELKYQDEIKGLNNKHFAAIGAKVDASDPSAVKAILDTLDGFEGTIAKKDALSLLKKVEAGLFEAAGREPDAYIQYLRATQDLSGRLSSESQRLSLRERRLQVVRTALANGVASLEQLTEEMVNTSWTLLLTHKFKNVIDLCQEGLRLRPDDLFLQTNLAHGLALSGNAAAARSIYLGHTRQRAGGKPWATLILEDFQALAKAGIKAPLFLEVTTTLKAAPEPPADPVAALGEAVDKVIKYENPSPAQAVAELRPLELELARLEGQSEEAYHQYERVCRGLQRYLPDPAERAAQGAKALEAARKAETRGLVSRQTLAEQTAAQAWRLLIAKSQAPSLQLCLEGLRQRPGDLGLEVCHAAALALSGDLAAARSLYLQHAGRTVINLQDRAGWVKTVLASFDTLEKAGLASPLFNELRTLWKAPQTRPSAAQEIRS
jgi:hypothetical protein